MHKFKEVTVYYLSFEIEDYEKRICEAERKHRERKARVNWPSPESSTLQPS